MRAGRGAEPSRHPRFQPLAAQDSPFPKSSQNSAGAGFCLPPQWSPRRRALGARLPRRSSGVGRGGDRGSWGDARRLIPPRGHARAHQNYTRRSHIHMLTEARSHADPDTYERPGSLAISAFSEQNHIKFFFLQTARQSEEPHAAFFCQGGWVGRQSPEKFPCAKPRGSKHRKPAPLHSSEAVRSGQGPGGRELLGARGRHCPVLTPPGAKTVRPSGTSRPSLASKGGSGPQNSQKAKEIAFCSHPTTPQGFVGTLCVLGRGLAQTPVVTNL